MFVHNKEKYLYYTFENIFLYCHWRSNNKEWSVYSKYIFFLGKSYHSIQEEIYRRNVFKKNALVIEEHNKEYNLGKKSYIYKEYELSCLTIRLSFSIPNQQTG
jgi:hypothetical protein